MGIVGDALHEAARFVVAWVRGGRLRGRRLIVLLGFLIGFPPFFAISRLGLCLDSIFFRGWKQTPVRPPLFIIGNFRSGTTFLHRLLAKDRQRFASMAMWEVLFAPSLTVRALMRGVTWVHRVLGSPLAVLSRGAEKDMAANPAHRVSFREPEEDDYLMLHVFSTLTVGLSAGLPGLAREYIQFDAALQTARKQRLMRFYADCVKRFLHGSRADVVYLAKGPALTPKLAALEAAFPGARFVVMVRDPREVLPSVSSMMRATWQALGIPDRDPALRSFLKEMVTEWYRYPALLAKQGFDLHFVRYERLVSNPTATVTGIYDWLGYEIGDEFREVLECESQKAREYVSAHVYSGEEEGYSAAELEQIWQGDELRGLHPDSPAKPLTPRGTKEQEIGSDTKR